MQCITLSYALHCLSYSCPRRPMSRPRFGKKSTRNIDRIFVSGETFAKGRLCSFLDRIIGRC